MAVDLVEHHAEAGYQFVAGRCLEDHLRAVRPLDLSITLGMYSHVGPTLHDEAAEAVAALLL